MIQCMKTVIYYHVFGKTLYLTVYCCRFLEKEINLLVKCESVYTERYNWRHKIIQCFILNIFIFTSSSRFRLIVFITKCNNIFQGQPCFTYSGINKILKFCKMQYIFKSRLKLRILPSSPSRLKYMFHHHKHLFLR